jgi:hypothetical protein
MSALTASASFLGMISGPIAAAADAKLSGSRVVATDTWMPLRANALADIAEADNCVAHIFSFGLPGPTALRQLNGAL